MTNVRELLRRYDLQPRKSLGQHYLIDGAALARIVAAAELEPQEAVLEVGPGLGTMTRLLAANAARVVAVELDRRLVQVLEVELSDVPGVEIVQGDILDLCPGDLMGRKPYKVVANLPYGITSAALRHFLEASYPPSRMVLTIQREVAERIIARDGRMSLLAVSVQFYGQVELLFRLKPGAFYPPPAVESAVIRIDRYRRLPLQVEDVDSFFRVVRAGFSQRRKQLRNSLSAGLQRAPQEVAAALRRADIDPRRRAERLSLQDWARLVEELEPLVS